MPFEKIQTAFAGDSDSGNAALSRRRNHGGDGVAAQQVRVFFFGGIDYVVITSVFFRRLNST